MKILLLLLLLLVPTLSHAADTKDATDDDPWAKMPKSTSAQACHANVEKVNNKLPEEERDSTQGQVGALFEESNCVKKLVNSELDKRLVPLKKSNPAQFKIEMKMQKDFTVGSEAACNAYNECVNDGTEVFKDRARCFVAMQQLRLDQATQLNSKKLSFTSKKAIVAMLPDMAKIKELSDFSVALCSIPDIAYAEKRSAADCKAIVIQNLAVAVTSEDPNATDPFHCDKTPLGGE